ncbi:dynein axonemal heavy chain 1-like [Anabrus simplex]|uniref:dynein axonemal heavy chain 1-like n=1 Tax=Anabrus simplex TaxID=316456 RepID=UPI0035A292BC
MCERDEDWLHNREIWLDNPLTNIDGDGMERTVLEMFRTANRLMKQFHGEKAAYELAEQVKNEIEEFRPMIPLIQGLRSPGMKQRHWNQVFELTGVRVDPSPFLTFNHCLSLGVQDYVDVITQIAETASKEYSIQQTLEKMQKEWEGMEMEVTPYKETGTYIMKIADEVTSMLDDHISITQQISFSPFKAALETEISDWETRLHLTKKVLEVWMELQKTWMYLEPIFASPDINRQLPVEGKRYSSMERTWRRIMKGALEQPKVIIICPDKRLFESLKDCIQQLEVVQKGLAAYLETKRTKFPRFYFLSDEELLEILAQSRNPLAVQPHLKKCFENINKLDFQEKDLHIIAMFSAEGERVVMIPDMYPLGNVEDWLLEVVRKALDEALLSERFVDSIVSAVAGQVMEIMVKKLERSLQFNAELVNELNKGLECREREIKHLKEEVEVKRNSLEHKCPSSAVDMDGYVLLRNDCEGKEGIGGVGAAAYVARDLNPQVEASMRNTIRVTLLDSLEDIIIKERNVWVLTWPGQIVIAGSQTFWTAGVEKGIRENALADFFQIMLDMLDGLRTLVKGQLKRVERQVLSALIVIEVHARDVTQKLLDEGVDTINDFDWISQLRYYSIEEQLKIRAVNAEFPYGYEYLGNSGRLVITPLTDRCYLTLTGALHLKFGGAPAGPAGTGKTETTKDLGKAFAVQCVVFNCSDQLDFMAMGKFFKGLASSGAWACFDEFNRIDIEVLSVVAQQITTIQKAQMARLDRFIFEGADIVLKESCAVFITMNPGYAGRTELPDNLKALFRPVAMMVPNYALIAEISLFSFGFSDAKDLAGKITTTFKLSSEQLSSQDHYDFGMRAVKTVIAVAGNLKRERPTMNEKQIVLRALRDVNVPKFLRDDLKLFNGIVSDLFPRMVEETIDYGILEKSISNACVNQRLEDVPEFVRKVIQLYETTVVRHGLMLVGPTGSGKTKGEQKLQSFRTCQLYRWFVRANL